MRGIFAAHIKDAWEIEEAENGFWAEVVQNAGQYAGKMPVDHWLAKMAKNQGIEVYWRRKRRRQLVAYQVAIAVKMRDDGEKDDLDLESLADKDAVAEEWKRTPDEVLEPEELVQEAHQVVTSFLDFVDEETAEAVVQNKVEGIPVEAWAKRTGKAGESTLKMQLSRVYQKMRKASSACLAAGSRRWVSRRRLGIGQEAVQEAAVEFRELTKEQYQRIASH